MAGECSRHVDALSMISGSLCQEKGHENLIEKSPMEGVAEEVENTDWECISVFKSIESVKPKFIRVKAQLTDGLGYSRTSIQAHTCNKEDQQYDQREENMISQHRSEFEMILLHGAQNNSPVNSRCEIEHVHHIQLSRRLVFSDPAERTPTSSKAVLETVVSALLSYSPLLNFTSGSLILY